MGMFSALVPNKENEDLGTESYEEIVDGYCAALEDLESEIFGLENLGESVDNAEAFATAIESCGATPALMKFGYEVDSSFEQLIGRAAPSDFATEDMNEFGAFALESIKSKLKIAWEHVKTFIYKLIEKIKEFGRWVLRLFDRKKARLNKIITGKADKVFDAKNINGRFISMSDLQKVIADCEARMAVQFKMPSGDKIWNKETFKDFSDSFKKISGGAVAGVEAGKIEFKPMGIDMVKQQSLSSAGWTKASDIIKMASECKKLLDKRADWERAMNNCDQTMGKIAKAAEATARNINDKGEEKGVEKYDKDRANQIMYARKAAIVCSKYIVCIGKQINNAAAYIIAVASAAGL